MSAIAQETVLKIAALARLKLTEAEAHTMTQNLDAVLQHFSVIQTTDTTSVPPADDVTGLSNVTRPDTAQPEVLATHDALLAAAPATHDRQLAVKAVF